MPKAPRHRKRVRTARLASTAAPLGTTSALTAAGEVEGEIVATGSNAHVAHTKKVGKKEAEVANLLEKLQSGKTEERVWASSALASLLLELPAVTLRLLLSKNLIGLLIERLVDTEDEVVVECLGALRNLAVSSPASILSEMHNKRLLQPLLATQLPLLLSLLPAQLLPAPAPHAAPLPSTPLQREAADVLNSRNETRRRLYWDWNENLITLLWCCAESNTKILTSLNTGAPAIVEYLMSFLTASGLGLDDASMEIEGKKGKKAKKEVSTNERVPLFVAVAAAQTLHAFISANTPAQTAVFYSPVLRSLMTILNTASLPALAPTRTDTHRSTVESDADDFVTLRVLCFGIILELTKNAGDGKGKGKKRVLEEKERYEEMRAMLKEGQDCLLSGLRADLSDVARLSLEAVNEMTSMPAAAPSATPTGPSLRLSSYEKKLSTLQLSLEILGEWCSSLDAEGLGSATGTGGDDEEESWGGNATMDEDGDMEMGGEDDEEMSGDGDDERNGDDQEDDMAVELSGSTLTLIEELPKLLLALALPTPLSFLNAPTDVVASAGAPPTLIPTSNGSAAAPLSELPLPLVGISEILTTIHVRALECLNNLYITLARSISSPSGAAFLENSKNAAELQKIWEEVLGLVLLHSQASTLATTPTIAATKPKVGGGSGSNGEEDVVEERRMEMVMAGVGVAWGMARIGLSSSGQLAIGPSVTPFIISLFNHAFALIATPAGESIRVRVAGTLGCVARRDGIDAAENSTIGSFLLSIIPVAAKSTVLLAPSPLTPETLLQVIDSFIDIYSDEESAYDKKVFRAGRFLVALNDAVAGIRAHVKKIDKKKFPELRLRADGALENVVAFIEYRRALE